MVGTSRGSWRENQSLTKFNHPPPEFEIHDYPYLAHPEPVINESHELLRGSFVIHKTVINGVSETRLVLLGFTPENRKLVYVIDWYPGEDPFGRAFVGSKVQDSPGMAREAKM